MNRFSRISTIWRKEFTDVLRDRRTLIAMILVPMVLYPALLLGSLQAFEAQTARLKAENYTIAVASDEVARWLKKLAETDPARRVLTAGLPTEGKTAEEVLEMAEGEADTPPEGAAGAGARQTMSEVARTSARFSPPPYGFRVFGDVAEAVVRGGASAGVIIAGSLPSAETSDSARVTVLIDQTEIRSQIAGTGLEGILTRYNNELLALRLKQARLNPAFVKPVDLVRQEVATPEKVGGSILGQVVPLILIIMTITGAIYPAIDLTAGERERGTLETLMVAPVPTVDLIAGKFVVVTSIGMLCALLNLVSIGGTIYLGGLGELLTRNSDVRFPFWSLPWVLLVLIPLAVMFSAVLLAVCSFARSFKEAQNYIMPVMVAALIPAVVGVLPGTRLEGALLVIPVTNIVVLTRELFMGRFDVIAVVWVTLSTCIYAGAAAAVAAKLFGQEAVLFADSASVKTIFQRRFFKPRRVPTAAQALLVLALVYPLHFFIQVALGKSESLSGNVGYLWAFAAELVVLFGLFPAAAAKYMRVDVRAALGLARPPARVLVAAVCFGVSTWVLIMAWAAFQQRWLPFSPEYLDAAERQLAWLEQLPLAWLIVFLAVVPAVFEELFFRGYALSGLQPALGKVGAVVVAAVAFAVYHQSVYRLVGTVLLGVLLGLLVAQGRSIWPAIVAHLMHNGLTVAGGSIPAWRETLLRLGFAEEPLAMPPVPFVAGAALLVVVGVTLCLRPASRRATEVLFT